MAPKPKPTKAKRISGDVVAGESAVYRDCPKCPTVRKAERPLIVPRGVNECQHCYGIRWQRENPVKPYKRKRKPIAKAKARKLSESRNA
jgi:hypothetical protein